MNNAGKGIDSWLPEIIAARVARKSWREIVSLLAVQGIKTNVSGVYQYFQRARKKQIALDRELRPFRQIAQISPLVASAAGIPVTGEMEEQEERRTAILRRVEANRAAAAAVDPEEQARQVKIESVIANLPHIKILSENKTNKISDEK